MIWIIAWLASGLIFPIIFYVQARIIPHWLDWMVLTILIILGPIPTIILLLTALAYKGEKKK